MTDNDQRAPEPPSVSENNGKPGVSRGSNAPGNGPGFQPNANDLKDLKTSQTLVMVASIAGPVSLFIGGVLLSTVGLVCAIIGLRKLSVLSGRQTGIAAMALRFKRSAIIGLVVCGIALILNAISFYLMFPVILDMVESGDYAGLISDTGTGAAGSTSTWG